MHSSSTHAWSLKRKLFAFCACAVLIVVLFGAWCMTHLLQLSNDVTAIADFNQSMRYVRESAEFNSLLIGVMRLRIDADSPLLEGRYADVQRQLHDLFDTQRAARGSALAALVEEHRAARVDIDALDAHILSLGAAEDTEGALAVFSSEEYLRAQGLYTGASLHYLKLAQNVLQRAANEHQANIRAVMYALVVFFALLILLSVILLYLAAHYVIRSLRTIQMAADSIARGDFSHRVPVTSHDEFGALANAINRITMVMVEDEERGGKVSKRLKDIAKKLG